MKIKTSELIGRALDRAVNLAHKDVLAPVAYSTDWRFGGPLIESEGIGIERDGTENRTFWFASYDLSAPTAWGATGPTPLVAAMRCYVASKIGNEIDVPEETPSGGSTK